MIKKVKYTVQWTYMIEDLNGQQITETVYKQELQKASQPDKILGLQNDKEKM